MIIQKVDILQVKTVSPGWRPVLCRIHTDAGIYGDGEACLAFGKGAPAAFGMLKDLAAMIIGLDPMKNEVIWQKLYRDTVWGYNGGPVVFAAISAIDTALWDIKGKALGMPIHALLGGSCRDKIHTYASQLQHGWRPELFASPEFDVCVGLDDYRRCAQCAMEEGFDAVKVDLLELQDNGAKTPPQEQDTILSPAMVELAQRRMEAVREVVGPSTSIIVEAHSHNSATGAVQLANALEPYGVYYYEEPNTPNPFTARYIAANTKVPLASGERIYSRWQYAPYLKDGSLRVIQPDIGSAGGLTEVKKICDMAHVYDIAVQPHVCGSPLSTYAALHLEAVIPNFIIHEHNSNLRSMSQLHLTKYNPQPVDGYLSIPDEPGLGNEIIPEAYENAEQLVTISDGKILSAKKSAAV